MIAPGATIGILVDLDVGFHRTGLSSPQRATELARHASREAVVPVDRDPVPQRYSDLVSRYYETLGKD